VGSSFYKSAKTAALISHAVPTPAPEENFLTKDSDGDGLSDRDEIIYATDPFNKDTDGDGYIDGEEIASGYDPLDPTSNSKTAQKASIPFSQNANLTDRLVNLSVASLINDSGAIDPNQMNETKLADIMQSINNEAVITLIVPPPTDADIKIIDDNSQAAVAKYLNSLAGIFEEGLLSKPIVGGVNEDGNISPEYPAYYLNIYNSLKIIEVPSSWKEIHKSTLTIFLQLANSFEVIQKLEEDPVKASFAINQVQSSFLSLIDILNSITQLAIKQNIPLDPIMQMLESASNLPQSTQ
jgi:hypothetical protein